MPKVLIAGCGFVGESAAGIFLRAGWEVAGMTGSAESASRLSRQFPCGAADLGDEASVAQFAGVHGPLDAVVHCASSGRGGADAYRRVYLCGARHLATAFPGARFVFAGSTSVYAQADGSWVDEGSDTQPGRETGKILLEAEAAVLAAGGIVARLAGIYGPGRSVLLRKFLEGTAILEDGGSRWINQIHRDDAAAALAHLAAGRAPPGIYNVADDTPATQREIYGWIASAVDRLLPPIGPKDENRKRGWTSKRISNAKLRATGWAPQFPSYRDALPKLLAA